MTTIAAPDLPGFKVTTDPYGMGTNVAGIEYATFDIARRDTARRYGLRLATLTVYMDGLALIDDAVTGTVTPADIRAIAKLRDMLTELYPNARHSSYRYVTAGGAL